MSASPLSRASDIIVATAMADRSFAGPYAYSDNSPFKVLAGTQKSVPIEYVIEALDEIQAGHGSHHAPAMQGVLKSDMPKAQRDQNSAFLACMAKTKDYAACSKVLTAHLVK